MGQRFPQARLAATIAINWTFAAGVSFAAAPSSQLKSKAVNSIANSVSIEQLAESANLMDGWRNYALNSLKTNFSWASDSAEVVEPPSIFNRGRSSFSPTPTTRFPGTVVERASSFQVAMQSSRIADSPLYVSAEAASLLPDYSPGLRRTVVAPSLTERLGEQGFFKFSAILAYQKFYGFDLQPLGPAQPNLTDWGSSPGQLRNKESSVGAGVRFDIGANLNERFSWQAGYQSRVNMSGFYSDRGITGEAGQFDIPPSANFGVGAAITSNLHFGVGIERVMYSQVTPFASYALPTVAQVLLIFGRRNLEWSDLDVYSADLTWHNNTFGELGLRYTTRQQPLPAWQFLSSFLQPNLASHNWELHYARAIGDHSTLRFAALYAPIQLLGVPSFNEQNAFGQNQMRLEALWSTSF